MQDMGACDSLHGSVGQLWMSRYGMLMPRPSLLLCFLRVSAQDSEACEALLMALIPAAKSLEIADR